MKENNLYDIVISGLSIGKHYFSFEIKDAFFAEFTESEVQQGNLLATVEVDKKSTFLQLNVAIKGTVTVPCDRCLDDLSIPILFEGTPIVKYGDPDENPEIMADEEDILWIDSATNVLNMASYLYDSIILSIPIQHVHVDGQCNKDMIEKLAAMQAPEQNKEKNLPFGKLKGIITNKK